ncbi:hypothetical protein QJQ45_025159, partial [Haematococcus lacustris]
MLQGALRVCCMQLGLPGAYPSTPTPGGAPTPPPPAVPASPGSPGGPASLSAAGGIADEGGREGKRPGSGSGGWGAASSRCVGHPGSGQLRDVESVSGEGGGRAGSGAVQLQLQHYGYGHRPWDMDTLAGRMGMQAAFQNAAGLASTSLLHHWPAVLQLLLLCEPRTIHPPQPSAAASPWASTLPHSHGCGSAPLAGSQTYKGLCKGGDRHDDNPSSLRDGPRATLGHDPSSRASDRAVAAAASQPLLATPYDTNPHTDPSDIALGRAAAGTSPPQPQPRPPTLPSETHQGWDAGRCGSSPRRSRPPAQLARVALENAALAQHTSGPELTATIPRPAELEQCAARARLISLQHLMGFGASLTAAQPLEVLHELLGQLVEHEVC